MYPQEDKKGFVNNNISVCIDSLIINKVLFHINI